MIFLKGGDSGMIAKCEAYQARVDLLKILLEANYPDLPTLQELSKMDTARRLRDKLIRDERLPLALEVCTKCGVEPSGVWQAWGRACLQCGDFGAARDKFAHCLKARDESEILIKMIRKEHNKLRSAYLTAAKINRAQDITRIMAAAERMGQAAVRNICKKWLEQHQKH
ncbi:hypothetical protein ACOMHN_026527 [Nucella lapillus]